MIDHPSLSSLLHFAKVCYYARSHWSVNSGWEWASYLAKVVKENIKEKIKESNFIALSLDEVIAIENTSWICMHAYTVHNFFHQPNLLSIIKMKDNSTVKNIFKLVKSSLN